MKKTVLILIFLISILSVYCHGQEKFIVTAQNGLLLRDIPNSNGNKLGRLNFGAEVIILDKTENDQVKLDRGKNVIGTWVKVKFDNYPFFVSHEDFGYVFDVYLKKKTDVINEIELQLSKYSELKDFTINQDITPFFLKGNFFGDKKNDLVILLKDSQGETKIGLINYGEKDEVHILGNENDPFKITNYGWIGIFEKVNPGEILWSNYDESFVDFKDLPESKKVKLSYNALYMHASESCGGGFVFWKDGKFNWLQQE